METHKEVRYEDDNFRFVVEYAGNYVLFHCLVHNYNVKVYRKMVYEYMAARDELSDQGYEILVATPNPKFAKIIDRTLESVAYIENEGIEYEVFKCHKL